MKNLLLGICLTLNLNPAKAQPQVFFNFLSHNEETLSWNNSVYYLANRSRLVQIAQHFDSANITWNMQSDWTYLTNAISEETPSVTATTNNKTILRYMYEDLGVEMDPHGHESQYIYPDLVHLMDSIGLPESNIMGGTLYSDTNGINIWTNLVNGQNGNMFPQKFWDPTYMMGGGTPNHVDDLNYYGFWNPTSPTDYLTHNPSSSLTHIGVGCEMKIRDTTTVSYYLANVRAFLEQAQQGLLPDTAVYLQTFFFSQGDLGVAGYTQKILEIADSLNQYVLSGQAQWKTLKDVCYIWETTFSQNVFQWECGATLSLSMQTEKQPSATSLYFPNPVSTALQIRLSNANENIEIINAMGQTVLSRNILENQTSLDVSWLASGIYLIKVKGTGEVLRFVKN